MTQWHITENDAGARLDTFLTAQRPNISRSGIQKLIKQGHVLVNGKQTSVHHFLKIGDKVDFSEPNRGQYQDEEDGKGRLKIKDERPRTGSDEKVHEKQPEIIAETSDWLVINKPVGLLVHPDAHQEESLVDWLIEHDPKIAKVGEHPDRPGIVHRLDREVSGLMVIAKTQRAYEDLQNQFSSRQVEKAYLALVHGELSKDEGDIKFRIARSSTQARMAARPSQEEKGRAAWTHYVVKDRFVGATLVEIHILSGRTHQIRAHFHALGHPVIGDDLYKRQKTDRNVKAPRLMLQSIGLTFDDPATHEQKSFTLTPDPAFEVLTQEFRHS